MKLRNSTMNSEDNKPSKPFWDMTVKERDALAQKAVDDAKERMHQNEVAFVEVVDGRQYLRHPNGNLTPIEKSES